MEQQIVSVLRIFMGFGFTDEGKKVALTLSKWVWDLVGVDYEQEVKLRSNASNACLRNPLQGAIMMRRSKN